MRSIICFEPRSLDTLHVRRFSQLARALLFLFLLLLGGGGQMRAMSTNLYRSTFEAPMFLEPFSLDNQGDWLVSGTGGSGIFADGFFQGQSAYVGLFPPLNTNAETTVWYPLDLNPLANGWSVVNFSVDFVIWDSTTNHPFADEFRWAVVNTQGRPLCELIFDVYDFRVFSLLNDGSAAVDTGKTFQTNTAHTLSMRLDYLNNRWSAVLSNHWSRTTILLATNLALNADQGNTVVDLGDIDASWLVYDLQNPGDNLMEFDRYTLAAEGPGPALLGLAPASSGGSPRLKLSGPSGQRYVIEAASAMSGNPVQWIPLHTNTLVNGSFEITDTVAQGQPARFYRARWNP